MCGGPVEKEGGCMCESAKGGIQKQRKKSM